MNTEFDLIRRHFAESSLQFSRDEIVLGIGDDAALVDCPLDKLLCIATDVLVEGTHFPSAAPPELIAHKALAVNLSDMAAMGASPFCFTLGLTLPHVEEEWIALFSKGLLSLAQEFSCPLLGGDTTRGPLAVAITVHGLADKFKQIRRRGAKVGDHIFVTGTLGDSAIALPVMGLPSHLGDNFHIEMKNISEESRCYFEEAYFRPVPRVGFGHASAEYVSSGIDLSDGLLGDLKHIISGSDVGARIEIDRLPFSAAAKSCASQNTLREAALFGGDDYELCFTAAPHQRDKLESLAKKFNIVISHIGEVIAGDAILLFDDGGTELKFDHHAYEHFR